MDHEVFVPFPAEAIRQALADPARVARSVPGLQQEAGAEAEREAVTGRLRLRIGGSTITYRGTLRLAAGGTDRFTAEAEATEARGAGAVKLAIVIGLEPAEGGSGTLLTFSGSVQADGGRLAEFEPGATEAAGHRLLDRFVGALTTDLPDAEDAVDAAADEDDADADDEALPEGVTVPESAAELDPLDSLDLEAVDPESEPPAEAAHARRTMIGRSAEEVDHAPPRGRYAPVPPPEPASATATLRWAAPAAAVLIAGAVVVGRVLRRRR
ncbi:SRPBCC domain-containing protein [Streptomyces sp. NBC_01537]|uniref:carbon monoxide dehydrogenase subunit G n=1 Tax=Streptomyces sp. NBC_01537 TaxID=2903896 RepID=UPI00386CFE93